MESEELFRGFDDWISESAADPWGLQWQSSAIHALSHPWSPRCQPDITLVRSGEGRKPVWRCLFPDCSYAVTAFGTARDSTHNFWLQPPQSIFAYHKHKLKRDLISNSHHLTAAAARKLSRRQSAPPRSLGGHHCRDKAAHGCRVLWAERFPQLLLRVRFQPHRFQLCKNRSVVREDRSLFQVASAINTGNNSKATWHW